MKIRILLLFILIVSFLLTPASLMAADNDPVIKTYCSLPFSYANLEEFKVNLLTSAKREAINELFGELITASTSVEDAVVTKDQIRSSAIGFVRVEGNPSFYNGDSLAEVCVTIKGYATDEDRVKFEPVKIEKRTCVTDAKLTASEIKEFTREEVIIQALLEYEPKLKGQKQSNLLQLMQRIDYLESAFIADTETYCVRASGYIVPIEIIALLDLGEQDSNTSSRKKAETSTKPTDSANVGDSTEATTPATQIQDCSEKIEYGQIMECTIDTVGQKHSHEFSADANDLTLVQVVRSNGSIEPAFELRDENGEIVHDGNWCAASGAKISLYDCRLPKAGKYTILVFSNDSEETGSYTLHMQRLNNPVAATELQFGQMIDGNITLSAENKYYQFSADAEDLVLVTLVRSEGTLEPSLSIRDEYGKVVHDGSWCQATNAKIAEYDCRIPSAGNYSILVTSDSWEKIGGYSLRIQRLNTPNKATELEFGQTIDGSISEISEYNYYSFVGDVGDRVVVSAARKEGTLEPSFTIRDDTGRVVHDGNWCQASDTKVAENECILPSAGVYSILVYSNSAEKTGSYILKIDKN